MSKCSVIGIEVKAVPNENVHYISRKSVHTVVVAINLPYRTVPSCLIDELRCKVNLGVIGPSVVLWDVFERTRWAWANSQIENECGRTARVVCIYCEVGLR